MKHCNRFSHRSVSGFFVALSIALGLLVAGSAQATLVTLSFSGTYDTHGDPVFGLSGAAVPYDFQITYDTALDTNLYFFAAGSPLGGDTTTHEWHGYSASGVTGTSLTFGTQTWTAGDLSERIPAMGVGADLWFDTDISLATPTRSWIFFSTSNGPLRLGNGEAGGGNIYMTQISSVSDDDTSGFGNSPSMTIAVVPEPTTLALVGLGVLVLASRRKLVR